MSDKRFTMDKQTAKEVIEQLLRCTDSLDGTVHTVTTKCDAETAAAYRDAIARVIADVGLDIMEKIFTEHPDLRP